MDSVQCLFCANICVQFVVKNVRVPCCMCELHCKFGPPIDVDPPLCAFHECSNNAVGYFQKRFLCYTHLHQEVTESAFVPSMPEVSETGALSHELVFGDIRRCAELASSAAYEGSEVLAICAPSIATRSSPGSPRASLPRQLASRSCGAKPKGSLAKPKSWLYGARPKASSDGTH